MPPASAQFIPSTIGEHLCLLQRISRSCSSGCVLPTPRRYMRSCVYIAVLTNIIIKQDSYCLRTEVEAV